MVKTRVIIFTRRNFSPLAFDLFLNIGEYAVLNYSTPYSDACSSNIQGWLSLLLAIVLWRTVGKSEEPPYSGLDLRQVQRQGLFVGLKLSYMENKLPIPISR